MDNEMRKCKECGKLFRPKGREQYCTDIHYRPCPVCGKPVEAKYLSDPARCCSKECQAVARANKANKAKKTTSANNSLFTTNSNELSFNAGQAAATYSDWLSDNLELGRVYVGPEGLLGFQKGHRYKLDISKRPNQCYQVSAYQDMTEDKTVDLCLQASSMISIMRYFSKEM